MRGRMGGREGERKGEGRSEGPEGSYFGSVRDAGGKICHFLT